MMFDIITLQLQFSFVLQNKIIKWAAFKKKRIHLKVAVVDWWETRVVTDSG